MVKYAFVVLAYSLYSPQEDMHVIMHQEVKTVEACAELAGNVMNIHANTLASRIKPGWGLQISCNDTAMFDD